MYGSPAVQYNAAQVQNSAATFEALLGLLRSVTNETTVQYTLALLDELTMMHPERAGDMHVASRSHPTAGPPNAPLTLCRLLTRADWYTQARAAKLLALALRTAPRQDPEIVAAFLDWITGQLRQRSAGDDRVLVATGALAGLLRSRDVRSQYALNVPILVRSAPPPAPPSFGSAPVRSHFDSVNATQYTSGRSSTGAHTHRRFRGGDKCACGAQEGVLREAVRSASAARSQMLYNAGLCLWQLSFDAAGTAALLKSKAVEPLVDLLKQGVPPPPARSCALRVPPVQAARLNAESA